MTSAAVTPQLRSSTHLRTPPTPRQALTPQPGLSYRCQSSPIRRKNPAKPPECFAMAARGFITFLEMYNNSTERVYAEDPQWHVAEDCSWILTRSMGIV